MKFRSSLAKITRNGVDIRIPPGHPLYLKARDEEGLEDFELVKLVAELGADDEEASVEVQQKLLEEAQLIKQQQRTQEQVVEPRKSRSTRVKTRAGRPSATLEKPTSEEVKQNVGVKRKISYEDVKDKPVLELTEEERMAIKEEPMEFDMSSLPSFTQFFMSQREISCGFHCPMWTSYKPYSRGRIRIGCQISGLEALKKLEISSMEMKIGTMEMKLKNKETGNFF
uniref:Uncharacterized protein n=1 Tax=Daucus carota subsp. sativus TaxID=79200 RepID=A0A164SU01_DAUCS